MIPLIYFYSASKTLVEDTCDHTITANQSLRARLWIRAWCVAITFKNCLHRRQTKNSTKRERENPNATRGTTNFFHVRCSNETGEHETLESQMNAAPSVACLDILTTIRQVENYWNRENVFTKLLDFNCWIVAN